MQQIAANILTPGRNDHQRHSKPPEPDIGQCDPDGRAIDADSDVSDATSDADSDANSVESSSTPGIVCTEHSWECEIHRIEDDGSCSTVQCPVQETVSKPLQSENLGDIFSTLNKELDLHQTHIEKTRSKAIHGHLIMLRQCREMLEMLAPSEIQNAQRMARWGLIAKAQCKLAELEDVMPPGQRTAAANREPDERDSNGSASIAAQFLQ